MPLLKLGAESCVAEIFPGRRRYPPWMNSKFELQTSKARKLIEQQLLLARQSVRVALKVSRKFMNFFCQLSNRAAINNKLLTQIPYELESEVKQF